MIKEIQAIPAFNDNYIWTLVSADGACVVDPGDAKPVIEYLESRGLNLVSILVTHHHPDHVGGLAALNAKYQPTVFGPGGSGIKGISETVNEGDLVTVFDEEFRVIAVPGHTMDHIAYYCGNASVGEPILFCGDTLFAAGCGRLFEGTPEIMHRSLAKLGSLPGATRVYCTHEYTMANLRFAAAADPGNEALRQRIGTEQAKRDAGKPTLPSSISLELATNPFLRCAEPALAESAATQIGHPAADEIEIFATIRRWKDNF